VECTRRDVPAKFSRNRNRSGLNEVLKLTVAALGTNVTPAALLQQSDQFTHLLVPTLTLAARQTTCESSVIRWIRRLTVERRGARAAV
jgi:hypothetical protein